MNAIYKQSDFFDPDHPLNSLFFNVGLDNTVITGALPEHCSVSGGPDPDGVLEAMAAIRGAKHTHHSNEEIGKLFDWVANDQPAFIHLIGHGAAGLLLTGCAQTSIKIDSMLDAYTHIFWREHMERLSRYDKDMQEKFPADDLRYSGGLLLEGSCIAAGDDGTRLMKRLANVTSRAVFAYTGLIIVKDHTEVLFEKGHQWIRMEPHDPTRYLNEKKPSAPSIAHTSMESSTHIAGLEQDFLERIDIFNIHSQTMFSLDGDMAQVVFSEISSLVAFQQEGHVLGYITYQLELHFKNQTVKADLFSKRLLKTSQGVSYFTSPRLISLLTEALQ